MHEYSMGEDLFGLAKTAHPELVHMDRELRLLGRLYDLYTEVLMRIGQYEEVMWTDLEPDRLESGLQDFSQRCRKMPKGLRDWPAYQVTPHPTAPFATPRWA